MTTSPEPSTSSESRSSTSPPDLSDVIQFVPANKAVEVFSQLPDVESVLGELCTPESLLGSILQSTHFLWIYPDGWVVTSVWSGWLDIVAWRNLSNLKGGREVLRFFERLAEAEGLQGVRITTEHKPHVVQRWLGRSYSRRLVEYVKKVS